MNTPKKKLQWSSEICKSQYAQTNVSNNNQADDYDSERMQIRLLTFIILLKKSEKEFKQILLKHNLHINQISRLLTILPPNSIHHSNEILNCIENYQILDSVLNSQIQFSRDYELLQSVLHSDVQKNSQYLYQLPWIIIIQLMSSLLTHTSKALASYPLLSKQYYSYSQQRSRIFKDRFMNHSSRGFYSGFRNSNHEVHYLFKKYISLSSSLNQLKFMPISLGTTPLTVTSLIEMNSKHCKNVIILNEHLKNALLMKIPSASSSLKKNKPPGVQETMHPDIFKLTSQSHTCKEFNLNTMVKFMKSFILRRCISTYSKRIDTFQSPQLYRSCSENRRRIENLQNYKHKKFENTGSEIRLNEITKSTEVLEEDVDKSSEFGSHDTTEDSSSFVGSSSSSMISNRELLPEHLSQYSELMITSPEDIYEKYELNEEKLPETVDRASHLVYEIGLTLMDSNQPYSLINMKCLIYSINKWDKLHLNYGTALTENLLSDSSVYRIPPSTNFQLKKTPLSPSKDTYNITNTCLFTVQGFNKRKNFYRLSTYAVVEKRSCQITPLDTSSSRSSVTTTTTTTTVSATSSKRSLTKLSSMSGDNSSTAKINNQYAHKSNSMQKKHQGVNTAAPSTVSSISNGDANELKSNRRVTSTRDKQIKMVKEKEEAKMTAKKQKKTEGFRYCPKTPLMKNSHLFLEKSVEKSRIGIRRTFTPVKPRQRYQQQHQQHPQQPRRLVSKSSSINHIKMLKRYSSSVQSLQKTKYANIYSPSSKLYQMTRPRSCSVPVTKSLNKSKDIKSSVKRHHSQSLDKVNTIKQNKLSRNKEQPCSNLNKPLRQNKQINITMTNSGKTIQISNIQLIKLQTTQNRIQAGNSSGCLTKKPNFIQSKVDNNFIASINANITRKLDIFMPTDKWKSLNYYLIKRQLCRNALITTPYPLNRIDKMKDLSILQFVLGRITNSRLRSVAFKREIDKMKRIQLKDDSTPEDTDTNHLTLASHSDISTKRNKPMTSISKNLRDSVSRVIENKVRLHSDKPVIISETCLSVKIGTTGEEGEAGEAKKKC
ncbi:unnamed protein product [Trichobilharzia szidati]|nr:unnamed protein product [Trichobilharzia szidati]